MNYIVCPYHLRKLALNIYKNINQSTFGCKFIDIKTYIKDITVDEFDIDDIKDKIKSLDLKIYKNAIEIDDFYIQVYKLKRDFVRNDTDYHKLDIHLELKQILDLIKYEINFSYKDFSNYYILDIKYDIFEQSIIDKMLLNNAKLLEIKNDFNNKCFKFKEKTISNVYESLCQDIILKELNLNDVAFLMCDTSQINLLSTILNRYNITFNTSIKYKTSNTINQFIALLDFYILKDYNSYVNLLKINYNHLLTHNSYLYLKKGFIDEDDFLNTDLKLENVDILSDINIKPLQQIEKKFINKIKDVNIKLKDFLNSETFLNAYKNAYNLIEDKSQIELLLDVSLNLKPEDINILNIEYIKNLLMAKNEKIIYKDAIEVNDILDPVYNKKYVYVLDTTYSFFKPTYKLNDLISEKDIENSNYPTPLKREENIDKRLNYLFKNENTIFTYSIISENGKRNQEINFLKDFDTYNLNLNEITYKYIQNNTVTNPNIIKDNTLFGSVSSFEKYFNCPFSYLMSKLIKEYKIDINLDASISGTILHKVMEYIVEDPNTNIEEIIQPYINVLSQISDRNIIEIYKENIINNINIIRSFNQMHSDSKFKFLKKEFEFKLQEYIFDKPLDIKLKFSGRVDRIDTFEDKFFSIIDYKTSTNTLDKKEVFSGRKLQLLTYAILIKQLKIFNEPLFVAYSNININPKTTNEFIKLGGLRKDTIKLDVVENIKNSIYENLKYNTYALTHIEEALELLKDESYLKEVKLRKDNLEIFPYETQIFKIKDTQYQRGVKQCMDKIYKHLIEQIKLNNFSIKPTTDKACKYCTFRKICHFNNEIEQGETIYEQEV